MCKIIAISNQKGGTAKSTTSVNLGIGLAQEGKRVLLIDADPQGSMTISLGFSEPDEMTMTLATLMMQTVNEEQLSVNEAIIHHAEGVDLIPANIELLELVDEKKLPVVSGVNLSSLKDKEQKWVEDIIRDQGIMITPDKSSRIKDFSASNELSKALIMEILSEKKPKVRKFVLKDEKIAEFFDEDVSDDEISQVIYKLLEEWKANKK